MLNKYGLTPENNDFEILSVTGGKLATDNYEFVTALHSCNYTGLEHEFYVAGWKYWRGTELLPKDLFAWYIT